MNKMQLAIIKKDLRSITTNKNIFITLLIVPFVFAVFFPTLMILLMHFAPEDSMDFQKMLALLPSATDAADPTHEILFLFLNRIMPIFFIIIPIMAASVMAASSFVGEKEKRTLETLLYCPLSLKKIFQSKIIASFALSMAVSFGSFLVMVIITQLELFFTSGSLLLPDAVWAITMLLISPALSLIAITIIVRGSAKAQTVEESQQRSVFLILPILLLVIGQSTGLFLISVWLLLGIGAVLAVVAFFFMKNGIGKPDYEKVMR